MATGTFVGIMVVHLFGATAVQAAPACQKALMQLEVWKSAVVGKLQQSPSTYNDLYQRFLTDFRIKRQQIYELKDPSACARPSIELCAQYVQQYGITCSYSD